MNIKIHQKLIFLSFIILLVNGIIGYSVYESNEQLQHSQLWVRHTERVITLSANVLLYAKDIETSSRGFVITNDSTFLEPLLPAKERGFRSISELKMLTRDNPLQQRNMDSLNFYMNKLSGYSFQTIAIRARQGLAPAIAYIATRHGKEYTEQLGKVIYAIQQQESFLLKQRLYTNYKSATAYGLLSLIMFILMAGGNIILLIFTGNYLVQNKEKEKRAAELIVANEDLAFENAEKEKRAAELIIANKELAFENIEKGKRAAELIVANRELAFENIEKEKRAAELIIANKELLGSQAIARYGNFKLDYSTGNALWSEQLCKIFGLQPEDNGRSYEALLSFVHPDDHAHVINNTGKPNATCCDVNFYHRIVRQDGTVRHLHTWQLIEFNDGENPASMHIVAHDITDETNSIIQLSVQNKQLREIAWIQSHKVRSPLAAILGLAQLFKDKIPGIQTEEIIQGILYSSEKLDKVIREIVDKTNTSDAADQPEIL